ncbi:hypothetical protein MLD38_031759 [Melastoma candidum]|uniref:Uncharacterized protein n=1 Tax=Melastoma candidum TaxID=119954 RepID=A0ACB9MQN3_9MYRT|nr:hypothetical protein MLD38_031759 [Melastoma candidum]
MGFHIHARVAALVVVSALFLASASAVALPRKLSQDNLITKLCGKTNYVSLCVSSVTENIKGQQTGAAVLTAEIDAAVKSTKVALTKATTLYKSASKQEKGILSTCRENYGYAIDKAADAKAAIAAHDAASLNIHLSSIIAYVGTCQDSYDDFSLVSPLEKVDALTSHLGSNCLKIASHIVL